MSNASPNDPVRDGDTPSSDAKPDATSARHVEKHKKEIPVVSVPHDDDTMAQEMADLFEEDQVTHQHGGTEPEGD